MSSSQSAARLADARADQKGFAATTAGHLKADELAFNEIIGLDREGRTPGALHRRRHHHRGAAAELKKFAEACNIPVTTTLMGIGGFPETHPLSLALARHARRRLRQLGGQRRIRKAQDPNEPMVKLKDGATCCSPSACASMTASPASSKNSPSTAPSSMSTSTPRNTTRTARRNLPWSATSRTPDAPQQDDRRGGINKKHTAGTTRSKSGRQGAVRSTRSRRRSRTAIT
jgi:hypothetical protein